MVFSFPDFPANITPQPLSASCSLRKLAWTKVYLNTSFCLVLHNTLWPIHRINHQINFIFTAPYASLARASKSIPPCTWSLLHGFTFSNHIQYHIRHSSPHAQLIFLPYTVFECRHNIRNQPVSTTIPSPSSFRNITTIRKHQHFGEILKYFFLMFFKTASHIAKQSTGPPPTLLFIRTQKNWFICAVATSLSVYYSPKNPKF